MTRQGAGLRRKTRGKLSKRPREKGKISIRRFLASFSVGDAVWFDAEPGYQKGMYLPRFHGRSGVVVGKQGDCYRVKMREGGKEKVLIVHPVHLKGAKVVGPKVVGR